MVERDRRRHIQLLPDKRLDEIAGSTARAIVAVAVDLDGVVLDDDVSLEVDLSQVDAGLVGGLVELDLAMLVEDGERRQRLDLPHRHLGHLLHRRHDGVALSGRLRQELRGARLIFDDDLLGLRLSGRRLGAG